MTAGQSLSIRSKPSAAQSKPTSSSRKLRVRKLPLMAVRPSATSDPVTPLSDSSVVHTPITALLTDFSVASTTDEDSKGDPPYVDDLQPGAMFKTGHEQTVNACLIDLFLSLTLACGLSKGAHFDRKSFKLGPKANPLYKAHVDGLVMIDDAIIGFMDVKANLCDENDAVKFLESAEMAAFIYTEEPKITLGELDDEW